MCALATMFSSLAELLASALCTSLSPRRIRAQSSVLPARREPPTKDVASIVRNAGGCPLPRVAKTMSTWSGTARTPGERVALSASWATLAASVEPRTESSALTLLTQIEPMSSPVSRKTFSVAWARDPSLLGTGRTTIGLRVSDEAACRRRSIAGMNSPSSAGFGESGRAPR